MNIEKRIVIDAQGNPTDVIISWADYQLIEEMLGLDLDEEAIKDLKQAKKDRESNKSDAYVELDDI